jgi:hypothetical protein
MNSGRRDRAKGATESVAPRPVPEVFATPENSGVAFRDAQASCSGVCPCLCYPFGDAGIRASRRRRLFKGAGFYCDAGEAVRGGWRLHRVRSADAAIPANGGRRIRVLRLSRKTLPHAPSRMAMQKIEIGGIPPIVQAVSFSRTTPPSPQIEGKAPTASSDATPYRGGDFLRLRKFRGCIAKGREKSSPLPRAGSCAPPVGEDRRSFALSGKTHGTTGDLPAFEETLGIDTDHWTYSSNEAGRKCPWMGHRQLPPWRR